MTQTQGKTSNSDRADILRLKWSDKDRAVFIEGAEDDRFLLRVREVINACSAQQKAKDFESQFTDLKNLLANWLHSRKDRFCKAFITVRDGRILFLVVTRNVEYDPEIDDMLTDLDLNIVQTPFVSDIPLSIQALPYCDADVYEGFLSPVIAMEYELS